MKCGDVWWWVMDGWHARAGSVLVSCSFPWLYMRCWGCPAAGTWTEFGYYVPFIGVSQVGWASVQISHLALIGHLATSQSEKTELVSYRYAPTRPLVDICPRSTTR